MVIATDVNLKSALQYGVNYLGIKHIIVCGHYECGGVRASMNNADVGAPLSMWLAHLRDVYRTHQVELNAIADPEARHRRMVEINAIEQCVNLFKTSVVQKQRIETSKDPSCNFPAPRIHACVFDPKDGSLKQLEINWEEYLEDLRDVYELYSHAYVDEMSVAVTIPEMPTLDDPKRENKLQTLKNFFGIGE
jgi:carbonic anhydrase